MATGAGNLSFLGSLTAGGRVSRLPGFLQTGHPPCNTRRCNGDLQGLLGAKLLPVRGWQVMGGEGSAGFSSLPPSAPPASNLNPNPGLPRWLSNKEPACQCRRLGFDPRDRKIPWRRKRHPTPVFLPGKSQGQRSLAGHSPRGYRRAGHNVVTNLAKLIHLCKV